MNRELVRECVHCGFCLPACPTYALWQEEPDSPRGRIYLLEQLLDGTMRLSPEVTRHFDRCLGCMACVSACPSGVRYDRLIELTRDHVEREIERPRPERVLRSLVFGIFPHPRRVRFALALEPLGRRLPVPASLRPFLEVAPPWRSGEAPPALTPAAGERIARAGLLTGCVQRVVFGDVNAATARVLAADGYEVVVPEQGCCGALSVHAGRLDDGLARARRLVETFERAGVELVVANAAGCGSHLKELGHLLAGDPAWAERAAAFSASVRDVSELLEAGGRAPRAPLALRVAYQDACHLLHAQRVQSAPRAALASIPGLELLEPAEQELCCGSAGIYNLVQPAAARELGDRKARNVLEAGPEAYAGANPGCLIHVTAALRRAGGPLPAFHPIELVDASIRGLDARDLLARARR